MRGQNGDELRARSVGRTDQSCGEHQLVRRRGALLAEEPQNVHRLVERMGHDSARDDRAYRMNRILE
jgi:hypothetical protein